jgi:hypothetical protein
MKKKKRNGLLLRPGQRWVGAVIATARRFYFFCGYDKLSVSDLMNTAKNKTTKVNNEIAPAAMSRLAKVQ